MSTGVLLTGATGFVGGEVLARYLERSDRTVYALVRGRGREDAEARLRKKLSGALGPEHARSGQVVAVPGDIQAPGLGLAPAERERLAERVGDIVHAAASVSFTLPLEESRDINVEGTRRVLEFAELCRARGGLNRLSYVSTAYVAGAHAGEFGEDDLDVGQSFRNPYEQSKFEAEQTVRSHADRLPIQVLRPSIVVGERGSGWTDSFNVLYAPLKAFARGSLRALPARRSAPVDVVPVDYVADAIFELANGHAEDNRTYHLVSGRNATTVGRLVDQSAELLRRRRPLALPPALYRRWVHPLLVRGSRGRRLAALERMEPFFPYFSMRLRYSDAHARRRLEPAGVRADAVEHYYPRLLGFALRARWGRAAISRGQARAEAAAGSVRRGAR